jgi:hypothetical protein
MGTPQTFPTASLPTTHPPASGVGSPSLGLPCAAVRPASTRFEPALRLEGLRSSVPRVHLPVLLAGPGLSGGANPSRRCRGCFPPSPAPPGSGCPQLHRPAATGRRWASSSHLVKRRLVAHSVKGAQASLVPDCPDAAGPGTIPGASVFLHFPQVREAEPALLDPLAAPGSSVAGPDARMGHGRGPPVPSCTITAMGANDLRGRVLRRRRLRRALPMLRSQTIGI